MKPYKKFDIYKENYKGDGIFRINPFPDYNDVSIRLVIIPPLDVTKRHNHTESEFWTVLSGYAKIYLNDDYEILGPGESIRIDPMCFHKIEALDEYLVMQTMWWHSQDQYKDKLFEHKKVVDTKFRIIVPAMLTPNGKMHLGHAAGPFIYADMLNRYNKMQGIESYLAQGTHGHLEHISIAAAKEDITYYELAKKNTLSFIHSLHSMGVDYDVFLTTEPCLRDHEVIYEIIDKLKPREALIELTHLVPFDEKAGSFCVDAFVHGECPFCHGFSSGTECESCGALVLDAELINPINNSGELLSKKPLQRLFLDLEKLRPEIEVFSTKTSLPLFVRLYLEKWLSKKLPLVCLTNPNSNGIPYKGDLKFTVPMEYVPRHLILLEKILTIKGFDKKWSEITKDEIPELTILFGDDNSFGRLLVIPAILGALLLGEYAPQYTYYNHMMNLGNDKFSTSRNHAIWVEDFVKHQDPDALRFFLMLIKASNSETSFLESEFNQFYEDFWLKKLGSLITLTNSLYDKIDGEYIIPFPGLWCNEFVSFNKLIFSFAESTYLSKEVGNVDFSKWAKLINALVNNIIDFSKYGDYFKTVHDNFDFMRTYKRLLALSLISLAAALNPISPLKSNEIISALNLGTSLSPSLLQKDLIMYPIFKNSLND